MLSSARRRLFTFPLQQTSLSLGLFRGRATAASHQENESPKPFSELPKTKGYPIIGSLIEAIRTAETNHIWTEEKHKEFGPIFRSKSGTFDITFLSDADAIEQLLRQDGKYPHRMQLPLWNDYRHRHEIPLGLVMSDGPEWHRLRRVIDKPMLKIRTVNSYTPELNKVTADFIDRLRRIRASDNSIPQLNEELYGWSVESIGAVLYEKRMNCFEDIRDPDTQDFINSSHDIFELSRQLLFLPLPIIKVLRRKLWQQHEEAWNTSFRVAYKAIDAKIAEIRQKGEKGELEELGFVGSLLKDDTITVKDIYSNVSELMAAAIDTTSNTTQMMMYELSRNPDIQDKLFQEVNRVIPPGEQPTSEHLKDLHYLKATIKETLRLHPTNSGILRILQEDVVILGYHLPKGTVIAVPLYVLHRHPKYYDDPTSFYPDRWLRGEGQTKHHPFAWLSFGFGARMCVGRRIAELEIQLFLSQLIRNFTIEAVSNEAIEMKTNFLLLPKTPVQIRLQDRR